MGTKRLAEPNAGKPWGTGDSDRVWVSIERKYRVAQYESLSVSIGASSSVDPDEDVSDATRRVFAQIRTEFADVVEAMRSDEGV